jgi:hypothetical protein
MTFARLSTMFGPSLRFNCTLKWITRLVVWIVIQTCASALSDTSLPLSPPYESQFTGDFSVPAAMDFRFFDPILNNVRRSLSNFLQSVTNRSLRILINAIFDQLFQLFVVI